MPFKPGASGNPGGLSRDDIAERKRVNELLLTPRRDERWLAAYDAALDDGVAPIILDYAYRRLGKPKETLEMTGKDGERLNFPEMTQQQRLEYLDALSRVLKGKP